MEKQNPSNRLFPVFFKLEALDLLIVGGGNVALEKLTAILSNSPDARVTVVADRILDEIFNMTQTHVHSLILIHRKFEEKDLEEKDLVILATDNPQLHEDIKKITRQRRIMTNVADTPLLCDFYLGSIVQKGDMKIAISTNGKSPTMAKRMREFLDEVIPVNIQHLLDNLVEIRKTIKGDFQEKIRVLNEVTSSMLKK